MKKPGLYFYSIIITGLLTILLAALIGYVTFFMKDKSLITTRVLLYNARWIEALLLLLFINLITGIFVNKLYRQKNWPILLLHLAFIFILTGAAITRYVRKDGKMELQEEETTDYVIPEDAKDQMVKTDANSYNS